MSSYSDRRRGKSRIDNDDGRDSGSFVQKREHKKSNYRDVDRISIAGSASSDQYHSAIEKRLKEAQDRIKHLEDTTIQQQDIIRRLIETMKIMKEKNDNCVCYRN
jgi:hypothetical protein